jgi:hypothetical protein
MRSGAEPIPTGGRDIRATFLIEIDKLSQNHIKKTGERQ